MGKVKINNNLAALMLVASIFGGWECLLLVTLLMFIFCEVDDKIQNVAIRVITFYVAYTIVSMGWSVIYSGVSTAEGAITNIVATINTYLDPAEAIETTKLIVPIKNILAIADSVMDLLFLIVKLGFVVSVFTFKPASTNPLTTKINEYVNKVLNYINGNVNVQAAAPASTTQQQ